MFPGLLHRAYRKTASENGTMISDESKLVEIFNNHYINIVESTTGHPPRL